MARAVSRCPTCGEPVSQFAAGCSICGTDLEAARAGAARRATVPSVARGLSRPSDDAIRVGVAVLGCLFAPLLGVLLAGWFAYEADRDGRLRFRNLMFALIGLSFVFLVAYRAMWGGVLPRL